MKNDLQKSLKNDPEKHQQGNLQNDLHNNQKEQEVLK